MPILCTNKAYRWPSHRVAEDTWGWLDYINNKEKQNFWLLHRIDKYTTGCLLLSNNKEDVANFEQAIKEQEVKKQYFFISNANSKESSFTIKNKIDNKEAITHFTHIKQSGCISLWQAEPVHGRTHQIRIHAKQAGIPLVGDVEYGNSHEIETFFLHCHKISLKGQEFKCPMPYVMQNLKVFDYLKVAQALHSIESRLFLMDDATNAYCLLHHDVKGLRIEVYGPHLHYEIYDSKYWQTDILLILHHYIEDLLQQKFSYTFQNMLNRGKDPNKKDILSSPDNPEFWQIKENNLNFLVKTNQGKSPGIFLDQREHRKYLQINAKDKEVLNLFCYTGAFSVNAAKGEAKKIVNVDTSKPSLEWLKNNLQENHLSLQQHEFWSVDTRVFLKGCLNKNRKFDIIICDPPSFARTKKNIFKLENEIENLIQSCIHILNPNGFLYFSCNFESWSKQEFQKICRQALPTTGNIKWARSGYDFEGPSENSRLKGFYYFL